MPSDLVLVTGASGFVGKWTVIALLRAGYSVRGSVRSDDKAEAVRRAVVSQLGEDVLYRLTFVKLNLMLDYGWAKAMSRVDAVMHIAAPVLSAEPRNRAKYMEAIVGGTERVLRFASMGGVRRVIMTSSVAAVAYGHGHRSGVHTYTEADYTNLSGMRLPSAYHVAKTNAERTAWAMARALPLDLTTILPSAILGPVLDEDYSASVNLVGHMLVGNRPAMPSSGFAVVDVRDVAAAHVAALQKRSAIGERYLLASDYVPMAGLAGILRSAFPDHPVLALILPNWLVRLSARFGGPLRIVYEDIGHEKHYAHDKVEQLLGRPLLPGREAILASASTLLALRQSGGPG